MGLLHLLLLLLLELAGWGWAGSLPEMLKAPEGTSIQVQCHYRPQDAKVRKVWCRILPEGCQPVVSSTVDRRVPKGRRTFLTDLGGGLLQVEMVNLEQEDAGEYGCMVEGASGPQIVHTVALTVLPVEVATHRVDLSSSASSERPSMDDMSIPLLWGAVFLLGLLVAAVVVLAVMVKRKGPLLRGPPHQ
ncbi:trem-like transcript 1 protein isoform X2 [Erinaceus europaeus]|uniref:Trem-like transcript 1 protein isoform X2 n=1 Tax=Erinaceus europaeus TaxID=9365 RepID=A0ABM3XAD1_ERIEU|nr:trem-like transcript 1 protein isoform X2 [Erinaceus europaeus]